MKTYLNKIKSILENTSINSLNLSLNNVHLKGVFSLVIDGEKPGELLRVFISSGKISPFQIQLHSHRYPINLTVLEGKVKQHSAIIDSEGTVRMDMFKYQSPLNGGKGLTLVEENTSLNLSEYFIPKGATIYMSENEIHTISCSKNSIWVVEELGFKKDYSEVLGVPFIIEGLYTKPEMFQINDKHQLVLKKVNELLKHY